MTDITITNPTTTITLGRASAYGTLEVEPERFAPEVQRYIYDYGLRQVLNDAMAEKAAKDAKGNVVKDERGNVILLPPDEVRAKALKRLDALYEGKLRARGDGAEPLDPVEAELRQIVRETLHETFKRSGAYKGIPAGTKNRVLAAYNARATALGRPVAADDAEMVAGVMAASPIAHDLRMRAERNVAERDAAVAAI